MSNKATTEADKDRKLCWAPPNKRSFGIFHCFASAVTSLLRTLSEIRPGTIDLKWLCNFKRGHARRANKTRQEEMWATAPLFVCRSFPSSSLIHLFHLSFHLSHPWYNLLLPVTSHQRVSPLPAPCMPNKDDLSLGNQCPYTYLPTLFNKFSSTKMYFKIWLIRMCAVQTNWTFLIWNFNSKGCVGNRGWIKV